MTETAHIEKLKATIVPVTPFEQNCTVLWDEATMTGAVVDPGGDLERIEQVVAKHGVTLEKILLTHGHLDHAGGATELAEKHNLPIEGPEAEEAFWLDSIPEQGAKWGLPGGRAVTPDKWFRDGDEATVGGLTFEVIHCPGHTPGHVVYYHAPSRLAIVGDVLFKGSIGRTDFPRGDHDALIRSITQKLWPLGDDVTFVPGHGPVSTFGEERKTNPFVGDSAVG